jgi:ribose transport system ATP-binding protein
VGRLRIRCAGVGQPTRTLSGGNQQKVVLARWLAARADILVFDEPTRGVDVAARRDVHDLIDSLVADGAAFILISSDLGEVVSMSDRILVMRDGAVVAEMVSAGATESRILGAALGAAS